MNLKNFYYIHQYNSVKTKHYSEPEKNLLKTEKHLKSKIDIRKSFN